MPGVLIVEALVNCSSTNCLRIDPKEYDNKLVYLMVLIKRDLEIK